MDNPTAREIIAYLATRLSDLNQPVPLRILTRDKWGSVIGTQTATFYVTPRGQFAVEASSLVTVETK